MSSTMEEPILSRLDRLDNIMKQLEMIKGISHSPKSSTASTTSSRTSASDDFSPRSLEKHCRPIDVVRMETGIKGTLIERLVLIEDRLLKLEEVVETEKKKETISSSAEKTSPRKSLKQFVKSCVKGKRNHKNKQHHHPQEGV